MIESGDLRHKVKIQNATATRDAAGGTTRTWATDKSVRAIIQPLSGTEFVEAQKLDARHTHKVTMRYYSGTLNTNSRLVYNDRNFYVTSISEPFEVRGELQLMVREDTGGG